MKVQTVEEFFKNYVKNMHNLLLISGDEFDLKEVISRVKKDFKRDNIEVFFKDDAENVIENLSMKTLFGSKLIIVYDVDTFPKSQVNKIKNLIQNPEKIKPNTVILAYQNKKNIPPIKNSLIGVFKPIYDSDIPTWIKRHVKSLGYLIKEEALNFLHFSFGTNREELRKQIEQLIGRLEEGQKEITVEQVKDFGFYRDDTIFRITNSLIEGNYKTAIQYLMECSDKQLLFYFINRDIRYLLVIKANLELGGDIKKLGSKGRLNLHNYFLYNVYKPTALKLSFKQLEKQYLDIIESEYKIKRGWDEFSVNLNYISQLEVGGK